MAYRLLLADDSVTIQKVIELTFADEDVAVVAVGDGDAAIAKLSAEAFDVVLADVGMPGKDGYKVAEFLRDRPGPKVPVLLLTGAFDNADPAMVAACGASGVLAKPFEPQVLVSRVRGLLAGGAATATAVPQSAAPPATPVGDSAKPAAEPRSGKTPSVDDYFERLDRAFANLNVPLEPREVSSAAGAASRDRQNHAPASPLAAPPRPAFTPAAESAPAAAQEPVRPASARGLADRFETMLAVEQGELPASALEPPVSGADAELVDRVARRVVEQLGDNAVRQLAAEIVSRTAERLVREEIDRIKAGIR
jgi:DNA-binding response OmpR family regulator